MLASEDLDGVTGGETDKAGMEDCDPMTAIGKKMEEAALTTMVRNAAKARMAQKFAAKIVVREIGSGTRLV